MVKRGSRLLTRKCSVARRVTSDKPGVLSLEEADMHGCRETSLTLSVGLVIAYPLCRSRQRAVAWGCSRYRQP